MARESSRIAPPSGLRVNRKSAVPVHVQLMTQIRHLISTGALKPGMQLPTVRQLAGFLRINPNTVARAIADLERDGYVEGQQGRGTFVADRPTREGRAARSLERLVGEIRRVLRPDGLLVYTVRTTQDAHFGLGVGHGDDMFETGGFIVHFFDRALVDRLASGFGVLEVADYEEGKLPRRMFGVTMRRTDRSG